jgi:DNA mismatch repair protein MutS
VKNFKVDVREYGDRVIFLHKVAPGFADHSYGIHVAKMAGLPEEITSRARVILRNLEGSDLTVHGDGAARTKRAGRVSGADVQMTLFEMQDDALRKELDAIDVNALTPLEAIRKLAELKNRTES